MDLVGFDEEVFDRILGDYLAFAGRLGFRSVVPMPISARFGDNVTTRSGNTPWHEGPTLLEHLETVDVAADAIEKPFRFPVQWVNRPSLDFRGFSGTVASGRIAEGERVVVAASGKTTRIARIVTPDGDLPAAEAGEAVTLTLADEIDLSRGDVLVRPEERPEMADQFAAHVLWMDEEAMLPGRAYTMRIGNLWTQASVTSIRHRLDVNTLDELAARRLELNEIGFCNLSAGQRVPVDPYAENRATGAFILVDRFTNRTAGAGMVAFPLRRAANIHQESFLVDKAARAHLTGQKPLVLWFTGLSGSGKSTVAKLVEQALHRAGPAHLQPGRRQHPPRPQPGSRLHGCRPRREHPPRRRGGQALRRCRADRPLLLHLALPGGASDGAGHARSRRVRGGLRRHADRRVHAPRPERPLCQGAGRKDPELHRHRQPLRASRGAGVAPPHRGPRAGGIGGRVAGLVAGKGPADLRMIPLKPVAMKGLISVLTVGGCPQHRPGAGRG